MTSTKYLCILLIGLGFFMTGLPRPVVGDNESFSPLPR